jgi:peroxiredoxin
MLSFEQPQETAEIFSSTGVEARAKKVGELVREFTVTDQNGRSTRLSQTWREGPLVIVFFRGDQCMRCELQLQAWMHYLRELEGLGASIVAITPQSVRDITEEFEGVASGIAMFSDTLHEAANAFGLSVTLPPEVVDLYAASGMDAPVLAADGSWVLPIPATFVVDQSGRIRFAHVDADSHHVIDPGVVLAALARQRRLDTIAHRMKTSRLARLLWLFDLPDLEK